MTETTHKINVLISGAMDGDKQALEDLINSIQSQVYNLSLRMLQSPTDAEDASQEILIKVVTRLSDFRGQSAFTTWVYRIAANHLMNVHRRGAERARVSFDQLSERLEISMQLGTTRQLEEHYDENLLTEEIKRSCTLGMLMCLDTDQRLALILGEVLEFSGEEAAAILEISPQTFRKRLSRAKKSLVEFVSNNCGIINPEKPCRCGKHIQNSIQIGKLDPSHLRYAQYSDETSLAQAIVAQREELGSLERTAGLLRSHPVYPISNECINSVRHALGIE